MKKLTVFLTFVLLAACTPNANDGLEAFSTEWCKVRIPPEWSTLPATHKESGHTVKELYISDPTSNVNINIQNFSPPIGNPGWNFAHQMLSYMNEIEGRAIYSGSQAPPVTRQIETYPIKAYCMNVTVAYPENPQNLRWETFRLGRSISDTFVIVSYPQKESDKIGPTIDMILKTLQVR